MASALGKNKREKTLTLETKHQHKGGFLYDVEVTNNYIDFDGVELSCSVVRDIRKRKLEEDLLLTVSEATSGYVGKDYFRELSKFITLTLGVKYALVTECANSEKTRVRTIAYIEHATPVESVEYDLEGTPCEIVLQGKDFFCATELEKRFPKKKDCNLMLLFPFTALPLVKYLVILLHWMTSQ